MQITRIFTVYGFASRGTATIIQLRSADGDTGTLGYDKEVGRLAGLPVDVKDGSKLKLVFYTSHGDLKRLSFQASMEKEEDYVVSYGEGVPNHQYVKVVMDLHKDGSLSDYSGYFKLLIKKRREYRQFKKALQPMTLVSIRVE